MGVLFQAASELYGTTTVENMFITAFMPQAKGDYVKIYLYGLKNTQNPQSVPLSNEKLAKELRVTENTIYDAYLYWEEKGLVQIKHYGEDFAVVFNSISQSLAESAGRKTDINTIPSHLKEVNEFKYLIQSVETYLDGKIITEDMMKKLVMWVEEYEMEYPCLYYLFDYCSECIGNNDFTTMGKFNYACKVADSWYQQEIKCLNDALEQTENYKKHNKLVYHVLRELGLKRQPIRKERNFVNKWVDTYDFSKEMIQEGINRTSHQSFEYLDSILTDWYNKGYSEPSQIIDIKPSKNKKENNTTISEDRLEAANKYEDSIFENFRKSLEALD